MLWEAATGERIRSLPCRQFAQFSPNGSYLVSRCLEGKELVLWDLHDKSWKSIPPCRTPVAFSPDDRLMAAQQMIYGAFVYDLVKQCDVGPTVCHKDILRGIAFSPDGKMVASASFDNTVKLWKWASQDEPQNLTNHRASAHGVMFSRDGRTLFSCGGDGVVRLWNVSTGQHIFAIGWEQGPIHRQVLSHDGRTLVTTHDYIDKMRFWRAIR